jgi:DNA-nicking Smr family endonuclease
VSKREKPFNNPFGDLKLKKPEAPNKSPPVKAAAQPRAKARGASSEEDESLLFLQSVGEVSPVRRGPVVSAPPVPQRRADHVVDPEIEALTELAELVAGKGPIDVTDTDEYIEGAAPGLDPQILRKLRAGDFSVQGHLDLHGLTRAEAKDAVTRFLVDARHQRKRCVLIVHGRGLHSKDQLPVLKEGLQGWLTRGRLADQVLAFSTARPHDGGAGAVYVLLRR